MDLKKLSRDEVGELAYISKDVAIQEEIFTNYISDISICLKLASNKNISIDMMRSLMTTHPKEIAHVFAIRSDTPLEILELINLEDDDRIAGVVALHPNVSRSILEKLYDKSSNYVIWSIAYNKVTPKDLLTKILKTDKPYFLEGLSGNTGLEAKFLEQIYSKLEDSTLTDPHVVETYRQLAEHAHSGSALLARLATVDDFDVAMYIASHKNTTLDTLLKLPGNVLLFARKYYTDKLLPSEEHAEVAREILDSSRFEGSIKDLLAMVELSLKQ